MESLLKRRMQRINGVAFKSSLYILCFCVAFGRSTEFSGESRVLSRNSSDKVSSKFQAKLFHGIRSLNFYGCNIEKEDGRKSEFYSLDNCQMLFNKQHV